MSIALSLLQPIDMGADDWPQWRGPNRDGVWRESGIFDAIPVSGLQVGWRARIGAGYSGPVVAQGRVFVTDHQFDPEVERVVCFEEVTGQQLWVHSYSNDYKEIPPGLILLTLAVLFPCSRPLLVGTTRKAGSGSYFLYSWIIRKGNLYCAS